MRFIFFMSLGFWQLLLSELILGEMSGCAIAAEAQLLNRLFRLGV